MPKHLPTHFCRMIKKSTITPLILLSLIFSPIPNAIADGGYDGPYGYGSWMGTTIGGGSSTTDGGSGTATDGGNSVTGGGGATPIGGKLGGYGFSGGGGPCEGGCEPKPLKKVEPAGKTPQQIAKEEKQKRLLQMNAYLDLARNVFEVGGSYSSIRTVEYATNKLVFEWASRAAARAFFAFYLFVRDGGIGGDPLDPTSMEQKGQIDALRAEIGALRAELKTIKTNDAKNLKPKTPVNELPNEFRRPVFDPYSEKEEDIRKKYLKNKELTKDQAKTEVQNFIKQNQGPQIGDLAATILEIYDQDTIDRQGLSQESVAWLEKFSAFVEKANNDRMAAQAVNSCSIPSSKKFCGISGGKLGDTCYCIQDPSASGIATSRRLGNICETKTQFCEVPGLSLWGTGCGCQIAATFVEKGSIKW